MGWIVCSTLRNDFFIIQDLDINIIVIAIALFGFKISSNKILLIQGEVGGSQPPYPPLPVYTSAVNGYSEMLKNFYKQGEKLLLFFNGGSNENTLFALRISIYFIYNHICFLYLDIRVLLSIERV